MFDTAKIDFVDEMMKVFNNNPCIISSIYIQTHARYNFKYDMGSVIIAFDHQAKTLADWCKQSLNLRFLIQ